MKGNNDAYDVSLGPSHPAPVRLWPLDAGLDERFRSLYSQCAERPVLLQNYDLPLPDDFRDASFRFFDSLGPLPVEESGRLAGRYFDNFAPIWLVSQKRNRNLWSVVLSAVTAWEHQRRSAIDKSTLFYRWGESHVLYGDSDRGFILMHRALEEDRRCRHEAKGSQARWFLSLDDRYASDLQPLTFDMATYVRTRLAAYRDTRRGVLSYEEFRAKFLESDDPALADLQLFFAYTTFKLIKLRLLHKLRDVADDQMAPLIFTAVLSNMLLVVDRLFKMGLYGHEPKMNASFLNHLIALKKLSWRQGEHYRNAINNSRLYDDNFAGLLDSLLNGTYRDREGRVPDPTERDVLLAYRLRNYSAHSVKSQFELWQRFPDVSQQVFNALFLGIERM